MNIWQGLIHQSARAYVGEISNLYCNISLYLPGLALRYGKVTY